MDMGHLRDAVTDGIIDGPFRDLSSMDMRNGNICYQGGLRRYQHLIPISQKYHDIRL